MLAALKGDVGPVDVVVLPAALDDLPATKIRIPK